MLQRNSNKGGFHRRSTDPDENQTWHVAKKLGVAQELNLASEDVRKDFANGVKNAADVVKFKNLDTDHPDVLKYTEALIKKSLAEPIQDETPWVQAMEDAKTALSNSKAKVYQSPSLKNYIQLRSKNEASGVINSRTNDDDTSLIDSPKPYDEILTLKENLLLNKNRSISKEKAKSELTTCLYDHDIFLTQNERESRVKNGFNKITENYPYINKYSQIYGIPEEVIASIILEEQYVQLAPDWMMVAVTYFGLGKHSTGLGAIRTGTGESAWDNYSAYAEDQGIELGMYDLPTSEVEWSYRLATDHNFGIQTMCLVLAMKAKENGMIESYDQLSELSDTDWVQLLYHYNGSGDGAKAYRDRVAPMLPYMKIYLEQIAGDNDQSW